MDEEPRLPFERLDFIYMPSHDPGADAEAFAGRLGGRLTFAIEAFGTRVAMVQLARDSPDLLLAGHLHGSTPILVYRVRDLEQATRELLARGCDAGPSFGIPHGPCCAFSLPGGQRIAIYERTRPEASARLAGRRDF